MRRGLVEAGASTGCVRDFGMVEIMAFQDPDGMERELALNQGQPLSMAQSRVVAFDGEQNSNPGGPPLPGRHLVK